MFALRKQVKAEIVLSLENFSCCQNFHFLGIPSMILAAGLTPAWQQILVLDNLKVGEVNRAQQALWCGSGKVLNAGIAAHHLGGPSRTLAPLGGPPIELISAEFRSMGVPLRWVPTRTATRVCTTIVDRCQGTITELVENGRPLEPGELDEFRDVFAEEASGAEVVILIGSLPAETPDGFYRELLRRVACPAVLDFRGAGLLSVLDLQPLVVKPNREELAQTLARPLNNDRDLLHAMRSLNERGAGWVVVTQGTGPVWVTSREAAYRLQPLSVAKVVNPIASGDAMAAGIAWGLRSGRCPIDSIRSGLAAAAQNVQNLLPCRLDPEGLESLAESVQVERVE
jgi:tagatose 6-phosphate kinase